MIDFASAPPTAGSDQVSVLWLDSLQPNTDVAIRLTAERDASQGAASFRSPAGCEAAGGKSGIFLSEGGTTIEISAFSRVASCLKQAGFWTLPAEPNDAPHFDGTLVVITASLGGRQHQARRIDTPQSQDFVACARAARELIDR
jgi:hypothetical protein